MALFLNTKVCFLAVALAATIGCSRAKGDEDAAIRKLIDNFAKAENKRDGGGLIQFFTADGDVVVQNTRLTRDQISKSLVPLLPWSETGPAVYHVQRIRMLHPGAALVDTERTYFTSTLMRSSSCTFVLAKENNQWRVASYRNAVLATPMSKDSPFDSAQPARPPPPKAQ